MDSDKDGLSDWLEVVRFGTDPGNADSDGDLLFDGYETRAGLNPNSPNDLLADGDNDGLTNLEELFLGSDPGRFDSAGDGFSDAGLIITNHNDSDGDGLSDAEERAAGTDTALRDSDHNGLPDGYEVSYGLNPLSKDSLHEDPDHDGVANGIELINGLNPMNADTNSNGIMDAAKSPLMPLPPDRDSDGLSDRYEKEVSGTRPDLADSDNDLLPDGFEVRGNLDPLTPTDVSADPDQDGVDNLHELVHRTDPGDADSDRDGVNDGDELAQGSNPSDAGDEGLPPPPGQLVDVILEVGDHSGSHSERYNLIVGGVRHQAPEFGVVSTSTYQFERGRSYPISIVHTGTRASGDSLLKGQPATLTRQNK